MTELQEVKPKNLLAIYDLSLDGQRDAKPVIEAKDCEDLAGALQGLPDQGECCRIYIAGNLPQKERVTLEDHLRMILPLYNNSYGRGFNSPSTQWAKTKPSLHHDLDLYVADYSKDLSSWGPRTYDLGHVPLTCSISCHRSVGNALVSE